MFPPRPTENLVRKAWLATIALVPLAMDPTTVHPLIRPAAFFWPKECLFAVVLMLALALPRASDPALSAIDVAWLGLVGWGLLSALVNHLAWSFPLEWAGLLGGAWLLFRLSSRECGRRPETRLSIETALLISATAAAALALLEASGFHWLGTLPRRPVSTLGNRNLVAAYCAIVLPLALARLWTRVTLAASLSVVALALTIVLCRARGAWLAGALELSLLAVAHFAFYRRKDPALWRQRAFKVALLSLGFVLVAAHFPWKGLSWSEKNPYRSSLLRLFEHDRGTGRERLGQYASAVEMARQAPALGYGPGQWGRVAPRFAHTVYGGHPLKWITSLTPNSDLARLLGEEGWPALALVLGLGALILHRAWLGWRRTRGTANDTLAPALALVALLSFSCVDSPFWSVEFLVLASALFTLAFAPLPSPSAPLGPRRWVKGVAFAIVPCLLVFVGARAYAFARLRQRVDVAALWRYERTFPSVWAPILAEQLLPVTVANCRAESAQRERIARQLAPASYGVQWRSALCERLLGNRERALEYYEAARRIEPHDARLSAEIEAYRNGPRGIATTPLQSSNDGVSK